MDSASEAKLAKVHPVFADKIRQLVESLSSDFRVVQGLRTFAEQDALFAKGRTKPGKRVTNARGGQSNHNYGLAVDLCPFVDGKPDWDNDPQFDRIEHAAKAVGLEWGGNWHSIVDKPHVQVPNIPLKECQRLYQSGGLSAVWAKANEVLGAKADVPGASDPPVFITYTVKAGDTLWNLASTYQVSVSRIMSLNGLTSDVIKVGQTLKIG